MSNQKNKIALVMKKIKFYLIFFFFFCSITNIAFCQDSTHIKWKIDILKVNAKNYQLHLTGQLEKNWYLYQENEAEGISGIAVVFSDSSIHTKSILVNSTCKSINDKNFENKSVCIFKDSIQLTQNIELENEKTFSILNIDYFVGSENNFTPEEQKLKVFFKQLDNTSQIRINIPTIDILHPKNDCGIIQNASNETKSKSLLHLFVIGFLGGLIALLTPCVFPMIPLTVSFFTKKASSKKVGIKNAFLYGFFIFFIYVLLSLPFHFLDSINPEFLNNISTNVYLNVIFFLIFIFFAFSFFGFYEITLPASLSTGADTKAGSGNIIGIFFMALTLALVSFSCTGPILGSLLAGSLASDGGAMQLTFGMGGFGLALAMPFALFALFPNWLNSLPKSGGWLNSVKVVLGFLELALAFKFLSNADLVKHWGLLKREIFIGIWIVIGIGLTLYLWGKIKFSHDSPQQKISIPRKILALIIGLFTLYLMPGVTNSSWANLSLISGFPPPLYYSVYHKESDCVLGLHCTKDYEEGLSMAKSEHKPLLIDFTGYACVNCRRMEENIWSDPTIFKLMNEQFIVVSLYVDDKKLLPAAKQFIYKTKEGKEKEILNYGNLWSTFETENFQNNAQPLYAILNNEEELLNPPIGYTPDKSTYLKWLQCGLNTYKKK
jgi:thiol:disulfide interchange protein DsbD